MVCLFLLSWVLEGFVFNVVLVEPEIPPNTGNIGRLCLATRSTLHLVKPLGFSLEDRQLRRSGLDYWEEVHLQLWDSFDGLRRSQPTGARYFFSPRRANALTTTLSFKKGISSCSAGKRKVCRKSYSPSTRTTALQFRCMERGV